MGMPGQRPNPSGVVPRHPHPRHSPGSPRVPPRRRAADRHPRRDRVSRPRPDVPSNHPRTFPLSQNRERGERSGVGAVGVCGLSARGRPHPCRRPVREGRPRRPSIRSERKAEGCISRPLTLAELIPGARSASTLRRQRTCSQCSTRRHQSRGTPPWRRRRPVPRPA
jgi:hypothetical protein